jgi:hypothetical protein
MGLSRQEAIVVGRKLNSELLQTWARQLAKAARKDFAAISRRGLTQPMLQQFETLAETVARLETAQEAQKKLGQLATSASYQALEKGLDWWREGRQMAKIEFSNDQDRMAQFRTGVRVGMSLPKLVREIEFFMEAFTWYSANLAWLGGKEFIERGKQVLNRLKEADAQQETEIKALPKDIVELYFQRGELYDLGRKIVRLGRLAWLKEPEKAGAYSFELLRRGQMEKKGTTTRAKMVKQ